MKPAGYFTIRTVTPVSGSSRNSLAKSALPSWGTTRSSQGMLRESKTWSLSADMAAFRGAILGEPSSGRVFDQPSLPVRIVSRYVQRSRGRGFMRLIHLAAFLALLSGSAEAAELQVLT